MSLEKSSPKQFPEKPTCHPLLRPLRNVVSTTSLQLPLWEREQRKDRIVMGAQYLDAPLEVIKRLGSVGYNPIISHL